MSKYSRPNSQTGSIRSQGSSNANRTAKTKIHLEYACYICGNLSSRPGVIIGHVEEKHGHFLPPQNYHAKRPLEREFIYVPLTDTGADVVDHCACPSCWFHCPQHDLKSLNIHTLDVHNPQSILDVEEDELDYEKENEENEEGDEEENVSNQEENEEDNDGNKEDESIDTDRKRSKRPRSRSSNRLTHRPNKRLDMNDDTSPNVIGDKLEELADLLKTFFTTKK
ncbi:hypothetical protein BD770DRAFT_399797 [Pilaira anomala]|nr:hypothetical protein BD770DRAFT_399797 [Pilaira anomala]